jgi:hypothetical protein
MKRLVGFLGLVSLFAAVGCGGGGGGGETAPTPQVQKVIVTTRVVPSVAPARAMAAGGSDVDFTVTLTLHDGTTHTMEKQPDGTYRCSIPKPGGTMAFAIEARSGSLVLKNFYAASSVTGDLDIGSTNAATTLSTDTLVTFEGGASIEQILSEVARGSCAIDVMKLWSDVVDGEDPNYAEALACYGRVLTAANAGLQGTTTEELLAADPVVRALWEKIESRAIVPPQAGGSALASHWDVMLWNQGKWE